ncbi:MAG: uncharacterized protein JWP01_1244 [Myxococcales bacterium]|nr:uncharacterized protein [Myxococcales bacterium]
MGRVLVGSLVPREGDLELRDREGGWSTHQTERVGEHRGDPAREGGDQIRARDDVRHDENELSGPRDYSASDVAAALSSITGASVAAQGAPLEAVVPTFTSFGMSAGVAELYREMYAAIPAGKLVWEGGAARQVRGSVELEETLRGLLKR